METISKPSKFAWQQGDSSNRKTLVIEPLFPGYGTTLGNALRRVLLNSLPGAAVVAVRIDGVSHEFSTIENVKEDIVEILLNIKQLRFRLHGDEPVTVRLNARGAKTVTAADIEPNAQVEVASSEQVIATLTAKDARLSMEFTIERGRGYVPTETRDTKQKLAIGTIAVDAIFTPVRSVGVHLENVRVGQMTNYDKLQLAVETDGTVSPQEAVEQSLAILIDQFQFLQTLSTGQGVVVEQEAPLESTDQP
ncbi:DNA-directed RNA polymerase subunit alpha [Candidatus Uhrbacteria bacterium]|nr:DNA-directed RNA polymerase subunit alpha [Candidatus Uhrbacteria bacterium]